MLFLSVPCPAVVPVAVNVWLRTAGDDPSGRMMVMLCVLVALEKAPFAQTPNGTSWNVPSDAVVALLGWKP
jgi:hypothetical protein